MTTLAALPALSPAQDAIARLAHTLLCWACAAGASALHLQRTGADARIAARIDGDMQPVASCSPSVLDAVAHRLLEHTLVFPAPGDAGALLARHAFSACLSSGASEADGTVARALRVDIRDLNAPQRRLGDLGLGEREQALLVQALRQPQGLVVVAAPARAGKTTTLYALLDTVDALARGVHTIEAPVARWRPPWQQQAAAAAAGLGAARQRGAPAAAMDLALAGALSRVLADHPGVLLLDGARLELPTRELLGAAGAGWLVLCPVAVERAHHVFGHFQAQGIAAVDLARHLVLVVAQRLVRCLCPACAMPDHSPELRSVLARAVNSWLGSTPVHVLTARPGGCAACSGRGYHGRALLCEVLDVDAGVRALAAEGLLGEDMERSALADGQSLWDQGLGLLAAGRTSLDALRAALREPR